METFIHHICIQTNHYQESLAFYQTLGFTLELETPNFHDRAFNSWLSLNGFYIELQTGKKELKDYQKEAQGIVHFFLYSSDLNKMYRKLKVQHAQFLPKNNQVIYQVANGKLFKVKAPEGTIIEFREVRGI